MARKQAADPITKSAGTTCVQTVYNLSSKPVRHLQILVALTPERPLHCRALLSKWVPANLARVGNLM